MLVFKCKLWWLLSLNAFLSLFQLQRDCCLWKVLYSFTMKGLTFLLKRRKSLNNNFLTFSFFFSFFTSLVVWDLTKLSIAACECVSTHLWACEKWSESTCRKLSFRYNRWLHWVSRGCQPVEDYALKCWSLGDKATASKVTVECCRKSGRKTTIIIQQ